MDPAYLTWLFLIFGSAALSLFAKPKSLLIVGAALTILSTAGIVISYQFGRDNLGSLFGVLTMATPLAFVMLAIGSVIANAIKTRIAFCRSRSG